VFALHCNLDPTFFATPIETFKKDRYHTQSGTTLAPNLNLYEPYETKMRKKNSKEIWTDFLFLSEIIR
jgi:hypothetical protein